MRSTVKMILFILKAIIQKMYILYLRVELICCMGRSILPLKLC